MPTSHTYELALLALAGILCAGPPALAQHMGVSAPKDHAYTPAAVDDQEAHRWRQDLAYLARELPSRHKNAFHRISREDWAAAVEGLDARIPELATHQIIVELARLVAKIGDGHTSMPIFFDPAVGFHTLPLRLGFYREGLFVEAADRSYESAVGGRITSIGGVPVAEAVRRISTIISHESERWVLAVAPQLLIRTEVLHALGLSDRIDGARLRLEKDGSSQVLVVDALPAPPEVGFGIPFMQELTDDWVDARDVASTPAPLWLSRPGVTYWFEYLREPRLLYIQFNQHRDDPSGESVQEFFERAFRFLDEHPVEKLVLDIRNNTGGEGFMNRQIVRGIIRSRKIDRPGKLFVIIGRRTFSAAQLLVNDLERWTRAIFVGEPSGATPNLYGNHEFLRLPNSGLTVAVAPQWFQTADPWDTRPWTAPLIAAVPEFRAYRENRDPAVEAILSYDERPTLAESLDDPLAADDLDEVRRRIADFDADPVNEYRSTAAAVNAAGYQLLRSGRLNDALTLFRLNVDLHPDYANGWDSLGEAYAALGQRQRAMASYERALSIDPGFQHAAEMLRRLRAAAAADTARGR